MTSTSKPRIEHRPDGLFWVGHQFMTRPPGWYIFYPGSGRIPNYAGPFKSEAACKDYLTSAGGGGGEP
jgi:hypothetical protein